MRSSWLAARPQLSFSVYQLQAHVECKLDFEDGSTLLFKHDADLQPAGLIALADHPQIQKGRLSTSSRYRTPKRGMLTPCVAITASIVDLTRRQLDHSLDFSQRHLGFALLAPADRRQLCPRCRRSRI